MRVQKKVLFLSVFLMIVGFAAVSTTLYLNGTIGIGTNEPDFDVYFSKAVEDGVENNTLIQDKTHLAFITELSKINEKYVLDYDVTNASKQYDASIIINCTGGNEYLRVENKFNVVENLKAREIRSGRLTLTVIKSVFEETEVNIACEITGKAVERTEVGGETIEEEPYDYLKQAETSSSATTYLGHTLDRSKVESITLKDTKEVPDGIESWDVSESQNGSILAYTLDENNNDLLELYIGQNGGVNANPDSSYLFYYFTNTISINGLNNLDTNNLTNMDRMFMMCRSVTSLDVSRFDTSKVTSMENTFCRCGALDTLDLTNFDTSQVTNMQFLFASCSSLMSLDVRYFNTSKVTSMQEMFSNCSNLTNVNISQFDTSNVTNMNCMFGGCSALVTLDVSQFDTSNVTNIREIFRNCSNLTSIDLSDFDTGKVTDMGYAFQDCSNLTNLDLSNFDTSNVTDMSCMFHSCKNLLNLDVSGFDTSKVTTMENMFYRCSNLTSLDLSQFDTSNVTYMDSMFGYCDKLNTIITIKGTKCISYSGIFSSAATTGDAKIIVNYTEDASDLVDQMIATKTSNSNVVKGSVVA